MATITKTDSGTWKALIHRKGWPTTAKTFRIKRDAEDWARTTEDEIVRGVYSPRSQSDYFRRGFEIFEWIILIHSKTLPPSLKFAKLI